MEVIILGSGTYQPELGRHSSSYLVKIGSNNIVIDFGRGVLDQLIKIGVNYYDIDAIFISHTHADHCSELSSFLHIALAEPTVGKFRKKDLIIYGPKGLKKTIIYLLKAFDLEKHKPTFKIIVKELNENKIVKINQSKIKSYKAKHDSILNCLCYRIIYKDKVFAYFGDTEDCEGLRKACDKADLAIIEASWPTKFKPKDHLTGKKAAIIAKEANVKKIVLTHIAPYYIDNYDIVNEAKKYFYGPVIIAKDLKRIKL